MKNFSQQNCKAIIATAAGAFALRTFLILTLTDPEWDSYHRFYLATKLIHDAHANWVWLPFYQYLLTGIYLIGGSFLTARILSACLGAISVYLTSSIAITLTGSSRIALLASAFTAFNPLLVSVDISATGDSLFLTVLLSALLLALRGRYLWSLLPMIAAGLIRYEGWVFAPFLSSLLMFSGKIRPRTFVAGSLALCIPAVFWSSVNYALHGDWLTYLWAIESISHSTRNLGFALSNYYSPDGAVGLVLRAFQLMQANPPLQLFWYAIVIIVYATPFLIFAAWRGSRRTRYLTSARILISFGLFICLVETTLLLLGWSNGVARYVAPVMPLISIFAALGCVRTQRPREVESIQMRCAVGFALTSIIVLGAWAGWAAAWMSPQIEASSWLHVHAMGKKVLCDDRVLIVLSGLPASDFLEASVSSQSQLERLVAGGSIDYVVSDYGRMLRYASGLPEVYSNSAFQIFSTSGPVAGAGVEAFNSTVPRATP